MPNDFGKYMVNYVRTKSEWIGAVDSEGIPLYQPRRAARSDPLVYHAGLICQHALAQFDLALDGVPGAAELFLRYARWLEKSARVEPRGRFLVWNYTFPLRTPPVSPPWISGMTQGQALSVLVRAFSKSGALRTAHVAHSAARAFLFSLDEGGVVSRFADGTVFIEEIAAHPVTAILNGCLYGICGLYEFLQAFPDQTLRKALDAFVEGVERKLPGFDTGYWSRYCLGIRWHLASVSYHRRHIEQLRYLGMALGKTTFSDFASRWEVYSHRRANCARRSLVSGLQLYANRAMTATGPFSLKYRTLVDPLPQG